jgi:uncharacterized UBP type Zn finger protein
VAESCSHLGEVRDVQPSGDGCQECLAVGDTWFHLRMCMSCGHIGCCDQSKNRHASAHFRSVAHPIIQSYEPNEDWWWCYVDDIGFRVPSAPNFAHP